MKRGIILLVSVALLGVSLQAGAHEMHKHKASTLTGEVVDTGCYLGHAARGADHVGCATKCINGGMPMGLLTGKGTLYLITMNHDNPDAYNRLKGMAGKRVTVRGEIMTRGGTRGIDVTAFKPVAS